MTQIIEIWQAGSGIGIDFANYVISNSGVLSFQGSTGDITLTEGTGISISGTTINVTIDNTYIILNSTGNVTINLTENYTWSGTHTFTGSGNIPVFEFGAEMKGTFQSAIGFTGHASLLTNGFGATGIMGLLGSGHYNDSDIDFFIQDSSTNTPVLDFVFYDVNGGTYSLLAQLNYNGNFNAAGIITQNNQPLGVIVASTYDPNGNSVSSGASLLSFSASAGHLYVVAVQGVWNPGVDWQWQVTSSDGVAGQALTLLSASFASGDLDAFFTCTITTSTSGGTITVSPYAGTSSGTIWFSASIIQVY